MNRTKYMIIFYDLEQLNSLITLMKNKVDSGFISWTHKWAYCLHDKDTTKKGLKKAHYHFLIDFMSPMKSEQLFDVIQCVLPNGVYEDINKADEGAYAYLIHANAPLKYQYSFEDIVHSDNINDDDLYDVIEKHRKITKETKNASRIRELFEFINDNYKNTYPTFRMLCIKLLSCNEVSLLGWCSNNVYLVKSLLESQKAPNEDFSSYVSNNDYEKDFGDDDD